MVAYYYYLVDYCLLWIPISIGLGVEALASTKGVLLTVLTYYAALRTCKLPVLLIYISGARTTKTTAAELRDSTSH